jgi:hypothetical protein
VPFFFAKESFFGDESAYETYKAMRLDLKKACHFSMARVFRRTVTHLLNGWVVCKAQVLGSGDGELTVPKSVPFFDFIFTYMENAALIIKPQGPILDHFCSLEAPKDGTMHTLLTPPGASGDLQRCASRDCWTLLFL